MEIGAKLEILIQNKENWCKMKKLWKKIFQHVLPCFFAFWFYFQYGHGKKILAMLRFISRNMLQSLLYKKALGAVKMNWEKQK